MAEVSEIEAGGEIRTIKDSTARKSLIYSTDEIDTKKTWIDGKSIYRKVFFSNTNWNNNQNIGSIGSFSSVIEIQSTSYNTQTSRYYTNYDDGGNTNCASVDRSGNVMVNRIGAFINNYPANVIIEYTKPTD